MLDHRTDRPAAPIDSHDSVQSARAAILASNGLVLALALWQKWPVLALLIPFLIENLVIGGFTIARLVQGAHERLPSIANGKPLDDAAVMRLVLATGFGFMYTMFNLGFFSILGGWDSFRIMFQAGGPAHENTHGTSALAVAGFALMMLIMVWHHYRAYRRSMVIDRIVPLDVTQVMLAPVMRVLVIHFSILLSGVLIMNYITGGMDGLGLDSDKLGQLLIILFMVIKTVVDLHLDSQSQAQFRRVAQAAE